MGIEEVVTAYHSPCRTRSSNDSMGAFVESVRTKSSSLEKTIYAEYFVTISTTTTKTELIWDSTKKHRRNDLLRIELLHLLS